MKPPARLDAALQATDDIIPQQWRNVKPMCSLLGSQKKKQQQESERIPPQQEADALFCRDLLISSAGRGVKAKLIGDQTG